MAKQKAMTSGSFVRELFTADIYKRSQGRIVRQVTAVALWVTALLGCYQLYLNLVGIEAWQRYLISGGLLAVSTWVIFRVVCYPKFADFLIATEAEMNKVSWPSRAELIRGSVVVLVTVFLLAAVLFLYDLFWNWLLTLLGVLAK
ncbi:Preprotein translocase subunit SecE [Planctomycetales bacterium 10988]|nr:Preprotein translocase subunit SecE [Planctomycetales bacterium 10988]